MKFRVLVGNHGEGGRVYHQGDVVETDIDLCAKFNTATGMKFIRVDGPSTPGVNQPDTPNGPDISYSEKQGAIMAEEATRREQNELKATETTRLAQEADTPTDAQLNDMTVTELRELADKEQANLSGLVLKDDLVNAITKQRRRTRRAGH